MWPLGFRRSHRRSFLLSTLFLLFLAPYTALAALINTTYDDTTASFKWYGHWRPGSTATPCTFAACNPPVDFSQVHQQTWQAGLFAVNNVATTNGTFTFTGSAVYIYGIDRANLQPQVQFTLGNIRTTHRYTGSEPFVYNSLFFAATGLPAGQIHVVSFNFVAAPTNVAAQEAWLDYAVVTSEGDVSTGSNPNPGDGGGESSHPPQSPAGQSSLPGNTGDSQPQRPSSTGSTSTFGAQISIRPFGSSSTFTSSEGFFAATGAGNAQVPTDSTTSNGLQSSAAGTHNRIGAILGIVIGVLAPAILIIIAWCLWRRSRAARRRQLRPLVSHQKLSGYPGREASELSPRHPVFVDQGLSRASHDGYSTTTGAMSDSPFSSSNPAWHAAPSEAGMGSLSVSALSSGMETERERMVEARLQELEKHVIVPPPY
ncbi:hypothetical protein MIND_00642400 [Mycena indigotica]|uniref:Mid2 domain-containing protein n=1 Tax=Mycena indigotica TaxID=2126181 RepID=A0A8H6SQS0_9AGAR|nr:uncharacterized protein MIND_00642400 [Mycena indigotica]KAF7304108.1 hypothetical protein MIND_00642400 [Mycena indigotica]